MAQIRNDVLTHAYATFDVSVYAPLACDSVTVEALARALAVLTLGKLPPGLDIIGASSRRLGETDDQARLALEVEKHAPIGLFRTALRKLYQMLTTERDAAAYQAIAQHGLNPFTLEAARPKLSFKNIEQALDALKLFIATYPTEATKALAGSEDWNAQWDEVIRYAQVRYQLFPALFLRTAPDASPFGLLHRYRQHFIYSEVCAGPLEVIQALAPNETLEVVLTETRSTLHEETVERELEVTSSVSSEEKDQSELADRVANVVSRVATQTMSASGSSTAVLWSASGSASQTVVDSSSTTTEETRRRLQDTTRKQSEEIRRRSKITTRVVETSSSSTTTRHQISNNSNAPKNYGLRRLGYNVNVKIEDLGPVMVWQSFVEAPGRYLATSDFIDLRWERQTEQYDEMPVTLNVIAAGFHPGDAHPSVPAGPALLDELRKRIGNDPDAKETAHFLAPAKIALTIVGIRIVEDFGSRESANLIDTTASYAVTPNIAANRNVDITLSSGPARWYQVHVTLTATLLKRHPVAPEKSDGDGPMTELEARVKQVEQAAAFGARRPRESLEYEERKALLAGTLSALTQATSSVSASEVQQLYVIVNEIFDLKQMFYDVDVTEWSLLLQSPDAQATPPRYPIHSKQERPAPLGSSLGWKHQLDGDERRDILMNAPWAWVGIPVKPGRESEAANFLKAYANVLSTDSALDNILRQMERLREAEKIVSKLAFDETVTRVQKTDQIDQAPRSWLDSSTPLGKLTWRNVYPLISQQYVVAGVQGFLFDEIDMEHAPAWSDDPRHETNQRPSPVLAPRKPVPAPAVAPPTAVPPAVVKKSKPRAGRG